MFIKFMWVVIIVAFVYVLVTGAATKTPNKIVNPLDTPGFSIKMLFFVLAVFAQYAKIEVFRQGYFDKPAIFLLFRLTGTFFASYAIVFAGIGAWAHIVILMSIMITSFFKGTRFGVTVLCGAFFIHMVLIGIHGLLQGYESQAVRLNTTQDIIASIFTGVMFLLIALFCGMLQKDAAETEKINTSLLNQLNEKYTLLEVAQEEIKFQYDKLKGTNSRLEETNIKLSASIAEFYTLQQISNAISSILDIKELLKYLNDIIIGVMGVSNSTITLYNEQEERLYVHTTNIVGSRENAIIVNNISCKVLLDSLNNNRYIIENEASPAIFPFTEGRDVGSLICMPLSTKTRKFGLVIIEHKYDNAFDEDNVRLLEIIAQQVGIAMENAELYEKMQELASKDGLTGIYNRQHFKKRLDQEFLLAKVRNLPLAVAIFDIDHFKRFNDTFGHLFGDKVLKTIAVSVSAALRKNDMIARFGGEEFIILFPDTTAEEAYEIVEGLRMKISAMQIQDNLVSASVTVSFGVSGIEMHTRNENELISLADDALYEAKAGGRNCVRIAQKNDGRYDLTAGQTPIRT